MRSFPQIVHNGENRTFCLWIQSQKQFMEQRTCPNCALLSNFYFKLMTYIRWIFSFILSWRCACLPTVCVIFLTVFSPLTTALSRASLAVNTLKRVLPKNQSFADVVPSSHLVCWTSNVGTKLNPDRFRVIILPTLPSTKMTVFRLILVRISVFN